jgi:hypothetical protein
MPRAFKAAIVLCLAAGLAAVSLIAAPVLRSLSFTDDFESGKLDAWSFPYPEDWVIVQEGGNHFLHMLRSREPGVPRRPLQYAMLKGVKVGSFDFHVKLRRLQSSVLIVFNYVDTMHFYYTHLSKDPGARVDVHNGLFIVNGKPRIRIAGLEAEPALPDMAWHEIEVRRNVSSGSIAVFVDGGSQPRFSVTDRTFTCGGIGIGSFDETGDFDNVHLESKDAGCNNQALIKPAAVQ